MLVWLWYKLLHNITSYTHTHTRLTALCPGLPGWAGTRKVKPIWILLKQETVSGSGISWAICKSAPHSRQITTPAPHHSIFYRPDALPAAQPTASNKYKGKMLLKTGVSENLLIQVQYNFWLLSSDDNVPIGLRSWPIFCGQVIRSTTSWAKQKPIMTQTITVR